MCYNNRCIIAIKTRVDGEESVVCAMGNVERLSSKLRFDYCLYGDDCTFIVGDDFAEQVRKGENQINMTFRKGETTQCKITNGDFSGSTPVFCDKFSVEVTNKRENIFKYKLSLGYMLADKKYELEFIAEYRLAN